jgi:glutamate/tyrosine decarboxylase-like PLP-dependent enzyme
MFTLLHCRHLVRGAERADSFAINPHKMLGAPLQCSMFLTRHTHILAACNAAHADYLFQPDKVHCDDH